MGRGIIGVESLIALLPYIGGGVAGSTLTWGLTWVREHRRTVDSYRAPQRHAVGEVLAAAHEFQLRLLDWQQTMTDLVEAIRKDQDESLAAIGAQLEKTRSAWAMSLMDLRRAFEVGHLTIVDAQCWEAMGAAAVEFEKFDAVLNEETVVRDVDDAERLQEQLKGHAAQLRVAMRALVQMANDRITPAETRRNRRRRREAQKRLTDGTRARSPQQPATPEV